MSLALPNCKIHILDPVLSIKDDDIIVKKMIMKRKIEISNILNHLCRR